MNAVLAKMLRPCNLPSWDRRGSEPRNEASGVVPKKRERSELLIFSRSAPCLKTKDALSRDFKGGSLRSRSLVPPDSPRSSARLPSYPRRARRFGTDTSQLMLAWNARRVDMVSDVD
jgi:hypothetical protein